MSHTHGSTNGHSNGQNASAISSATKLRQRLESNDILVAPGVYEGFSARIALEVGFECIYMTGAGTVASKLGRPDLGFASLNDMREHAEMIANLDSSVPLIADADTGYGGPNMVARTVAQYHRSGVAGLHIEDQIQTKRCGHLGGKAVVDIDTFEQRIAAAYKTRKELGSDIVIIARTDALQTHGFDEAIRRLQAAVRAGADVGFLEGITTEKEAREVCQIMAPTPMLLNMVEHGATPSWTPAEAAEFGFKIIIFPFASIGPAYQAIKDVFVQIKETGRTGQSTDMENEIQILREQLRASQSNASTSSQHNETNWPGPAPIATPGTVFNTLYSTDAGLNFSPVGRDPSPASTTFPHATLDSSVTNDADMQCLTTRPGLDPPSHHRASLFPLARPRALGNVILQIEEIDELFSMYIKFNNPYLPIIDEKKSAHEYYERSDLLFWVIMAVAARRHKSQPTLLPRLARNVTDLLWKTLRSMSYSISTIRALCLLCTWPFPTSSSTSDPTFMLVGTMLQMGTQMGLHCAFDAQDFAKVPLQLDVSERSEWAQTWEACNVVAISVSIGCGLPLFFQIYESPSANQFESSPAESPFYLRLQIERFKLRVSSSLARPMPIGAEGALMRERSTMFNLLNSDLDELEKRFPRSCDIEAWYLMAARLHLQAFYLFDNPAVEGYKNRIVALFSTAYNLVDLSQRLNNQAQGFFDYCPFFCYQTYVNAAFVLLRILTNGFFNTIVDAKAGKQLLESSITGLRQMSVVNNDLPARLGDIIGFFCALPDPAVSETD
ncbi:methylisocitrate lyase [Fusarium tjaetaba]|uniref:Methylisocitrate lyase n=1 Tax=Fusarium tjaetaba TaxID=1567544 RepID=A0A8H5VRV3_9HYPO|nr:methylisocitrate lyase [Fusarium tjaetaba]KAF5632240.1 methylisocitrate lyase [Fusarium tjaetaba]